MLFLYEREIGTGEFAEPDWFEFAKVRTIGYFT